MGIFDTMTEPVFLKESSDAELQLEKLKAMEPLLNSEGQEVIRRDIKYLEYGIAGEKAIAFELQNSHMLMYILHDIYLEDGDLNAQIDYLVITKKLCFVIECKNLYGNIEITKNGDFIRTMEYGRKKIKEGIYSPITQNERHLELLKNIRIDSKSNGLLKLGARKYFGNFHKSVVVLANSKTVLNAKYAKKEIREKVIRADQLVGYIKDMDNKSEEIADSESALLKRAKWFLDLNKNVEKDYTAKYEKYRLMLSRDKEPITNKSIKELRRKTKSEDQTKNKVPVTDESIKVVPVEETELFMALKKYRLDKSKEEQIKAYWIFSNKQLEDLIFKLPKSKEELKNIAGFGEIKVEKYGEDITRIIKGIY
ncbi:MAG: NERD domain-containing protein [Peptostreptococcaceae bacterium]|nr:NERD domain-containing protein [Peptostreptococcaceae bacterium]